MSVKGQLNDGTGYACLKNKNNKNFHYRLFRILSINFNKYLGYLYDSLYWIYVEILHLGIIKYSISREPIHFSWLLEFVYINY